MKPGVAAGGAWRRLVRHPAGHFLALGGLLFAAAHLLDVVPRETIQVKAADLQQLRDDWMRSTGRPPTAQEFAAGARHWAADEALFREALRKGLDERDPVVAQRLLRNMRFIDPDGAASPVERVRAARALGMVRSDFVVRRRLVQRMEQDLLTGLRLGEADLRAYIEAHPERYARPPRYRFEQVFAARDSAGAEARIAGLASRLRGTRAPAAGGDAFPLALGSAARSHDELARQMGPAVADAVAAAPPGEWVGPVRTVYGWHLLRVLEVVPGAAADLDQVREAAALALQAERRTEHLARERARIAARYRVEWPDGFTPEPLS